MTETLEAWDARFMALRQVGPSLASAGGAGRGRDTWATVGVLGHKAIVVPPPSSSSTAAWSAWTVSDLGGTEVRLALFGSASATHYATSEGTVVLLVGCRPSRHREDARKGGVPAAAPRITADAAACIIPLGSALEYARCAARTRAGEPCTRAVNAAVCPVCEVHAPAALARLRARQGCLSDSALAAHLARGVRAGVARRPRTGGAGCAAVAAATAPRQHGPEEAAAAAAAAYTGRSRPSYGVRVVTAHVHANAAAEAAAAETAAAKAVAADEARLNISLTPADAAGGVDPAVARAALAARLRARAAQTAGAVARGADAGTVGAARAAAATAAAASRVAAMASAAAGKAPAAGPPASAFAAAFADVVGSGEGGAAGGAPAQPVGSLYGPAAGDAAFLGAALDRLGAAEALAAAAAAATSTTVRALTCSACGYTAERPRPDCRAAGHGRTPGAWTWGAATKRWWSCDRCGTGAASVGGAPPAGCNKCGPGNATFSRVTAAGRAKAAEARDAKRRREDGFQARGEEKWSCLD